MSRARRAAAALLTVTSAMAVAPRGRAADPARPPSKAPDLERALPSIAVLEGGFSWALSAGWAASAKSYSSPYVSGILGIASARILYGTSWSLLLAAEGLTARAIGGPEWGWVGEGMYRADWLGGFDVPAGCPSPGAGGGCGVGLGSFSEARLRLRDAPLWLGVSGGWIQGRYAALADRTLVESTWILSPLSVRAELPLRRGPVEVRLLAGASIAGGLHNAHAHPRGAEQGLDVSRIEMVPLDGGAGGGPDALIELTLARTVRLEAAASYAPFVGGTRASIPEAAPLTTDATGALAWRRVTFGATARIPGTPVRLGLGFWAGELSRRPIDHFGHHAVAVRLEVPLREPK